MNNNEVKKGFNQELRMHFQSYSKVLSRLGSEGLIQYARNIEPQLNKLHNHLLDIRPKASSKTNTFREYGDRDNEKKIEAWEADQPDLSFQLVQRPDRVSGVFIKTSDASSNWYTLPDGLNDEQKEDFFQNIVACTIITRLLYGEGRVSATDELSNEQIQKHKDWVIDSIS